MQLWEDITFFSQCVDSEPYSPQPLLSQYGKLSMSVQLVLFYSFQSFKFCSPQACSRQFEEIWWYVLQLNESIISVDWKFVRMKNNVDNFATGCICVQVCFNIIRHHYFYADRNFDLIGKIFWCVAPSFFFLPQWACSIYFSRIPIDRPLIVSSAVQTKMDCPVSRHIFLSAALFHWTQTAGRGVTSAASFQGFLILLS